VRNVLSDVSGQAVQANVITGGVHFHHHDQRADMPHDTPHEVPGPLKGFVNRAAELAALDGLLRPDAVGFGVLSGLAGIGKSSTMRQWVHRSAGHFPDARLYVDYAAWRTEGGTAVGDALAACLRSLGVTQDNIPTSPDGRAGMLRTRTAGKRCLIVLDDVTEYAQVLPFVPNTAGNALLVTSNDRLIELELDGADLLPMRPLDDEHGVLLLRSMCGEQRILAEEAAAVELVRLCEGLPVALRAAAGRLLSRPRLRLVALVGEMAGNNNRLDALTLRGERPVSAVFDNVYQNLDEKTAAVYRRLGLVPGLDISVEVAVAATGMDEERVRDALHALVSAFLLDEIAEDRFRFHDLVRSHARECAEREEPDGRADDVLRAVSGYFLAMTAFADRAIMGEDRLRIVDLTPLTGGDDPFDGDSGRAMAWLVAERANLVPVLRAVAASGWDERAWQSAELLVPFYLNRRDLADWIEASDLGADAARRAGNADAEARLRSVVSRAYTDLGELDRAGEELARARALVDNSDNLVLVASVWEFTGRYLDKTDPPAAIDAYWQSIKLNTAAGEQRGPALAWYFLGCALDAVGEHDKAVEALTDAHQSLTALGDSRMAGRALISLGVARARLGDTEAARADFATAITEFETSGATHYEAQARAALADLLEQVGDVAGAMTQVSRVLEIRQSGGGDVADLVARLDRLSEVDRPSESAQ
jgi:tetratricopeptide (TPR) repeat protein